MLLCARTAIHINRSITYSLLQGQLLATRLVEGVPAALEQSQLQSQLSKGHSTTSVGVDSSQKDSNAGASNDAISSRNSVAWVQVCCVFL